MNKFMKWLRHEKKLRFINIKKEENTNVKDFCP